MEKLWILEGSLNTLTDSGCVRATRFFFWTTALPTNEKFELARNLFCHLQNKRRYLWSAAGWIHSIINLEGHTTSGTVNISISDTSAFQWTVKRNKWNWHDSPVLTFMYLALSEIARRVCWKNIADALEIMQMLFKVVRLPIYFWLFSDKTASQLLLFQTASGTIRDFRERAESLIPLSVSNKVGRLNFFPFSFVGKVAATWFASNTAFEELKGHL